MSQQKQNVQSHDHHDENDHGDHGGRHEAKMYLRFGLMIATSTIVMFASPILTSERAGIEDVRVRELADTITATQRKEIKEMDWLLQDIEENGPATTPEEAEQRPVPSFEGTATGQRDAWRAAQTLLRALLALPLVGNVAR